MSQKYVSVTMNLDGAATVEKDIEKVSYALSTIETKGVTLATTGFEAATRKLHAVKAAVDALPSTKDLRVNLTETTTGNLSTPATSPTATPNLNTLKDQSTLLAAARTATENYANTHITTATAIGKTAQNLSTVTRQYARYSTATLSAISLTSGLAAASTGGTTSIAALSQAFHAFITLIKTGTGPIGWAITAITAIGTAIYAAFSAAETKASTNRKHLDDLAKSFDAAAQTAEKYATQLATIERLILAKHATEIQKLGDNWSKNADAMDKYANAEKRIRTAQTNLQKSRTDLAETTELAHAKTPTARTQITARYARARRATDLANATTATTETRQHIASKIRAETTAQTDMQQEYQRHRTELQTAAETARTALTEAKSILHHNGYNLDENSTDTEISRAEKHLQDRRQRAVATIDSPSTTDANREGARDTLTDTNRDLEALHNFKTALTNTKKITEELTHTTTAYNNAQHASTRRMADLQTAQKETALETQRLTLETQKNKIATATELDDTTHTELQKNLTNTQTWEDRVATARRTTDTDSLTRIGATFGTDKSLDYARRSSDTLDSILKQITSLNSKTPSTPSSLPSLSPSALFAK